MKTEMFVNDKFIPLNDFNQGYIGNILRGIVVSLGYSGREFSFYFDSKRLKIYSGHDEVEIRKEFVRLIVEKTVKGMISCLKGVTRPESIMIKTEE